MIFIINNKKYDTDKMIKIADVEKFYSLNSWVLDRAFGRKGVGRDYKCELWKSDKNNWLITHERDYGTVCGEAISENEAKELLLKFDFKKYEELFEIIEET